MEMLLVSESYCNSTLVCVSCSKISQQDDRFYNDDDEDEEDDDDSDDVLYADRRRRFQKAVEVALNTDMQGYRTLRKDEHIDHTPQELTAISWAAFCTELLPEETSVATFRIQALDCADLFERLKLALHMLRQKKVQMRAKLERAGIQVKGDEFDDDGASI